MHELLSGDCLSILRSMEDKSVACIITDPPYGIGLDYEVCGDTSLLVEHIARNIVPEMRRVAHRVVLTPGINNLYAYPQPTWVLAWYYKAGRSYCRWGFSCWQPVLVYGKDPYLQHRLGGRHDIIEHNGGHFPKVDHPCPKPLGFIEKLTRRVSVLESDTVLDPFMGSGTTGVAAKKLNRRFIGIDLNPRYVEIARQRIAAA